MIRRSRFALLSLSGAVVLVVSALSAPGLAAPRFAAASDTQQTPKPLRILESSADHTAGTFARSATIIEFAGTATSAVRTKVTLSVGGETFSASKNIKTGQARWSGAGASLQPEHRAALAAFSRAMQAGWVKPANAAGRAIPLHHDLLIRFVTLLAEAPVGVKIGTQHVPRPVETTGPKLLPASTPKVESCLQAGLATTDPNTAERRDVIAQCQQSHEDDIRYLPCNTNAWIVHDADSHCLLGESLYVGPYSYECLGQCGGGCEGDSSGEYTYDCGDHDRCGRVHGGSTNPWDGECGDEYWEADDDFFWAGENCTPY